MKGCLGIILLLLLQGLVVMLVWNVLIVFVCGQLIFGVMLPIIGFWKSCVFGVILSIIKVLLFGNN